MRDSYSINALAASWGSPQVGQPPNANRGSELVSGRPATHPAYCILPRPIMSMVHLPCVCSAMIAPPHAGCRTRYHGDGRRRRGCISHPLVKHVPFILTRRHVPTSTSHQCPWRGYIQATGCPPPNEALTPCGGGLLIMSLEDSRPASDTSMLPSSETPHMSVWTRLTKTGDVSTPPSASYNSPPYHTHTLTPRSTEQALPTRGAFGPQLPEPASPACA